MCIDAFSPIKSIELDKYQMKRIPSSQKMHSYQEERVEL